MSKTIRRNKFNKKNRFYHHYWESFSEQDAGKYQEVWKYHSDNYYTKMVKDRKQFYKKLENKSLRADFKKEMLNYEIEKDVILNKEKRMNINWKIH